MISREISANHLAAVAAQQASDRGANPGRGIEASVDAISRRIRVTHLVTSMDIGGLEMVVLQLLRLRNQSTFDMRLMCLDGEGAMAQQVRALGVEIEDLGCGNLRLPGRIAIVRKRLRETGTDVVHTHNMAPHLLGVGAKLLGRTPVLVHTKHGRNYPKWRKRVLLNRCASWFTDCVVCVSNDAATVARSIERVAAGRLRVIRNGVDLEEFNRSAPDGRSATPRAIHVARLHSVKDQATLLRAVRLVADVHPAFHLDIVGDGPKRQTLEDLIGQLGLRKHVTLWGFRQDVSSLLRKADFFILSSISEGISLTLLEAMASGLPIVATDVGGNREVVADGTTGLLVPPRSPEQLAGAILQLLNDPARIRQMGIAARQRVEDEFNLRTVVSEYENLYIKLLNEAGRLRPAEQLHR